MVSTAHIIAAVEIDISEVHDAFTILELMHYTDLGFTLLGPAAGKES
jgi:acetyl-CoA acetyltransferase